MRSRIVCVGRKGLMKAAVSQGDELGWSNPEVVWPGAPPTALFGHPNYDVATDGRIAAVQPEQ